MADLPLSAAYMLYAGFKGSTHLLLWLAAVAAVALAAYGLTRMRASASQPSGAPR